MTDCMATRCSSVLSITIMIMYIRHLLYEHVDHKCLIMIVSISYVSLKILSIFLRRGICTEMQGFRFSECRRTHRVHNAVYCMLASL